MKIFFTRDEENFRKIEKKFDEKAVWQIGNT